MRRITPSTLRRLGALVLAVNICVGVFSLVDLYVLAVGAVQVQLPGPEDFALQVDLTDGGLAVTSVFVVDNAGVYQVFDLDIDATLWDGQRHPVLAYHARDLTVPARSVRPFVIEASLSLSEVEAAIRSDLRTMLVAPTTFTLEVVVTAAYVAGLARFWSHQSVEHTFQPPLGSLLALAPTWGAGLGANATDPPSPEVDHALQSALRPLLPFALIAGESWTQVPLSSGVFARYAVIDGRIHLQVYRSSEGEPVLASVAVAISELGWGSGGGEALASGG